MMTMAQYHHRILGCGKQRATTTEDNPKAPAQKQIPGLRKLLVEVVLRRRFVLLLLTSYQKVFVTKDSG
jgi:hypothetical protein